MLGGGVVAQGSSPSAWQGQHFPDISETRHPTLFQFARRFFSRAITGACCGFYLGFYALQLLAPLYIPDGSHYSEKVWRGCSTLTVQVFQFVGSLKIRINFQLFLVKRKLPIIIINRGGFDRFCIK